MPGIVNVGFEENNELENLKSDINNKESYEKEEEDNVSKKKFDIIMMARNALEAYISRHQRVVKFLGLVLLNSIVVIYFAFASYYWVKNKECMTLNQTIAVSAGVTDMINWRPVLCGMIMQFLFGLFTIRWSVGREIFDCISNKITIFLDYAKEGDEFIFSEELVQKGIFAFSVIPVIFFFSCFIQILYYIGVMQWVVMKFGWGLQCIMGTTICESLNCVSNTFIGMTESLLLIKPYLNKLTSSEIHAVMCSGFASVSGSVFAAYVKFGADPAHLLIASVMSAPAALCYSKLFYPETEKSETNTENIQLEKSNDSGVLDAASNGALAAIPVILGIIANIIAFISFVAFINGMLLWFGQLLGFNDWKFERFLSKIFMPLSWIMGVPWKECEDVGYLIGIKTVVNEFIAYKELGKYKKQKRLSSRSEAIATYALCGFSNPACIGIMIGVLSNLAPNKKKEIIDVTMRAFTAGSAVCFLTASVAGMLIDDNIFSDRFNATSNYTLEY
ncbi:solute carrier family 28 member 3-like isoform X1 [Vespula squamosa]|uniref:Sodium/nucleoside cotransporter n=1 Tax=Vespula squamosa TaxID=30214 RepID=A0ABD2C5X2_VESSQ